MKVKRLEEERERSFNEPDGGPDLDVNAVDTNLCPLNPTPSGDDSDDRENRSLDESNSTSKKEEGVGQNGVVRERPISETMKITKKKETGAARTGDEPEAEREKETAAGGGYKRREKKERNWGNSKGKASAVGDSNEAWESVSESKQEGKEGAVAKQQSSDVQSSAGLSQRKRCRSRGGNGTSSGEEPEVSPAKPKPNSNSKSKPNPKPNSNPAAVKSEPLLKFLEIIRSHRLGSAFERRLRSQVRSPHFPILYQL